MKEKLRITSLLKNTEIEMRTKIANRWEVLTERYDQISVQEYETNPLYKGVKVLKMEFSTTQPFWDMEFDTDDLPIAKLDEANGISDYHVRQSKDASELNRKKRIAAREFFTKHWQLENRTPYQNGHKPPGTPAGYVELLTQKARQYHISDRLKSQVFAKVDALSWQEQYDLMLYYKPSLAGSRRSEVLQGLIGLKGIGTAEAVKGGVLWHGNNAEDYLNNYENNPTVVMKIYVNKAAALGILEKGNGGLYMKGGTFVGATPDDAVQYFSKDLESYTNIIQSEVNKLSNLPDDDMGDLPPAEAKSRKFDKDYDREMDTAAFKEEYKRLCQRVEAAGGEMPYKIRTTELKLLVEALEARQLQMEKDLATVKLEEHVNPGVSDDINVLKAYMKQLGIKGYGTFRSVPSARAAIKAFQKNTENATA
jgi:hypothetical protein